MGPLRKDVEMKRLKRFDIMVDLETLGISNNTVVFQISACSFDIVTGHIHEKFNEIMDIATADNALFDGSTLKWWLNTDKELLANLINKGKGTERELFAKFANWINLIKQNNSTSNEQAEVFLWGNGILFDNAKIKDKCAQYNIQYPIFYRNDRDVRTIVDLAAQKLGFDSPKPIFESLTYENMIKHNAFDDVLVQIKTVSICWNILLQSHPHFKINYDKETIAEPCDRMKMVANTNNGFYWFAGAIDEQTEFLIKNGDQIICSDIITQDNFDYMYGVYLVKLYNYLYNSIE